MTSPSDYFRERFPAKLETLDLDRRVQLHKTQHLMVNVHYSRHT